MEGCVKGYHVYRNEPDTKEKLTCVREWNNRYHSLAVAVIRPGRNDGDMIGHVPHGLGNVFSKLIDESHPITW